MCLQCPAFGTIRKSKIEMGVASCYLPNALDKELAEVLKKTSDGLRTRVNVSFDEWTDRAKRSWMAVNVTYVKDGIMKRRLLSVTAFGGAEETAKAADTGSSSDGE